MEISINGILISADDDFSSVFVFVFPELIFSVGEVEGEVEVEEEDESLSDMKYATLDREGRIATPITCSFKLHL